MKRVHNADGVELFRGDCLEWLSENGDRRVDLFLIDPPYGIALKNNGWSASDRHVIGDADPSVGLEVLQLLCGSPVVAFASPKLPWPGKWRQVLAWDKGPAVGGGGDPATCFKNTFELIHVANTKPLGVSRGESVLKFHVTPKDFRFHPCAKPVPLLEYLIEAYTEPGDLVVDLFAGSGSTLVASRNTGRRAVGVEVRSDYCSHAKARLEQTRPLFV